MSFIVYIIDAPIPIRDSEAWKTQNEILVQQRKDKTKPSERFIQLHNILTDRFPCISQDPNGPWTDGPLINNFTEKIATLGIEGTRVAKVMPFLIKASNNLGFTVFDPQERKIFRPGMKKKWWEFWKN